MADTGLPWELPYPLNSDLVRDGAENIKDLAEATAAGLTATGGLVAVKSALFDGTQSQSLAAGARVSVTSLSITHALADAANKLVIIANIGATTNTTDQYGNVGIAVADGGTLINVGATPGSRVAVSAGGRTAGTAAGEVVAMPSLSYVYAPGDTTARTYTVEAINIRNATRTVVINRSSGDTDSQNNPRAVSTLVIMEVKV